MLPLGVRLVMVGGGLLHAAASATRTVTGRVFNPATGNYVASAEVRIAGTGLLVSTDASRYRARQPPNHPRGGIQTVPTSSSCSVPHLSGHQLC